MGVAMLCCHVQWCSINLSKNIITHTVFKNEAPDQEIVIDIFFLITNLTEYFEVFRKWK